MTIWVYYRYALDVNVERAEDVLMHKRLLLLAHDPDNRPVIEVRLVQVSFFSFFIFPVHEKNKKCQASIFSSLDICMHVENWPLSLSFSPWNFLGAYHRMAIYPRIWSCRGDWKGLSQFNIIMLLSQLFKSGYLLCWSSWWWGVM